MGGGVNSQSGSGIGFGSPGSANVTDPNVNPSVATPRPSISDGGTTGAASPDTTISRPEPRR
jgi:hypothetical protein